MATKIGVHTSLDGPPPQTKRLQYQVKTEPVKWSNAISLPSTSATAPSSNIVAIPISITATDKLGNKMVVWVQSTYVSGVITVGFVVISVNLSGTNLANLGAQNQGAVIAAITTTTSPAGNSQNTPIVLGGTDAAKFSVSNGGMLPCNLIAAVDIPAGSYNITLSCT